MAARGSVAKTNVEQVIEMAFGKDYVGKEGGKLYIWANDGSERVQIAISMTCPKNALAQAVPSAWDDSPSAPESYSPAEITKEEEDNIQKLLKELGL